MQRNGRKCKFGVLSRPDGSVMLCEGETTIMSGFYGPVEARTKNVLIDKASVEVYFRPKAGLPGVEDRFYEAIIRNICETSLVASLYPRSSVLVVIQEMHNNGEILTNESFSFIDRREICFLHVDLRQYIEKRSLKSLDDHNYTERQLISCAINAACLAAMDAAIEMRFMFAAVNCYLLNDDSFHMEAEDTIPKKHKAFFIFVFDSLEGKVIASHTEGCFSQEQCEKALHLCRLESNNVFKFFKESMLSKS